MFILEALQIVELHKHISGKKWWNISYYIHTNGMFLFNCVVISSSLFPGLVLGKDGNTVVKVWFEYDEARQMHKNRPREEKCAHPPCDRSLQWFSDALTSSSL